MGADGFSIAQDRDSIRHREDFGVGVKTAFVKDPSGNVIEMTDVPPFN